MIIAILASILLPVLSKSKRSAMNILCISNLRQVGIAQSLYCDMFDRYPPFAYSGMSWASMYGGIIWNTGFTMNQTYKKFNANCIFRCPSQIEWLIQTESSPTTALISYGWNGALLGWTNYSSDINNPSADKVTALKPGNLKLPGKTLVVGEGWNAADYTYNGKTYKTRHIGSSSLASESSALAFRHNRKMNVLYGDNHVASEPQRWIIRGNNSLCPWNVGNKGLDSPLIGLRAARETSPYN